MRVRLLSLLATSILPVVVPLRAAVAQVFVLPERADKAQVRRFDFTWRYVDVAPESPAKEYPAAGQPVPTAIPGAQAAQTPVAPAAAGEAAANALPAPQQQASGKQPASTGKPQTEQPAEQPAAPKTPQTSKSGPEAGKSAPKSDKSAPESDKSAPESGKSTTEAKKKSAGLRLYFYEREGEIAKRAIPLILDAYAYLSREFHYMPTQRFPYILYNTYQEFLETRLFPVQEGILGVTSPIDLTLTLPYFGDHRRFVEVSTHEMAHQFTIQKLRDIAKSKKVESPMEKLPLWFNEGLAEFYAHHGIDPETEMLARDLVVNPDPTRGYALLNFFEDRPGSVLWTYKLGQARVAFMEDTYGAGMTQRILERAYLLEGGGPPGERRLDFAHLLEHLTGDNAQVLAQRFADWLKRRSFRNYLEAAQSPSTLLPLDRQLGDDPLLGLASSPDGNLLLYRRIDITTGQTQLLLLDRRDPHKSRTVVGDGAPGAESLHPVSPRNFDLTDASLVYVAQNESHDVIYWREVVRTATRHGHQRARPLPPDSPWWGLSPASARLEAERRAFEEHGESEPPWDITLSLGEQIAYDLGDIVSVESPALSPDGLRVAFIGTGPEGFRDVYLLDMRGGDKRIRRLTHDAWAERQVSWGTAGIVYTSDATESGKFNLFRVDPDKGGPPQRLTSEPRDEFDPLATRDGRIYFVAYQDSRADVHEVEDGKVIRRTDVATGLTDVCVGPDGGLWTLWVHSGRHVPVRIERTSLLSLAAAPSPPGGAPVPLAERALTGSTAYSAFSPDNWRLGPIFGLLGAGGGYIFGQVFASATDLMRDHVLVLNVNVFGSFELTDGMLLYINQANRIGWGTGAFQSLNYYVDRSIEHDTYTGTDGNRYEVGRLTTYERFFGALGLLRVPFSTFEYMEASLSVGGVRYFLDPVTQSDLSSIGMLDLWNQRNDRTLGQVETSLSLGHDTVRYHAFAGPIDGSSALAQVTLAAQPQRSAVFGEARLDAAHFFALGGASKFLVRAGAGTSFGGRYAREFYLSSFDTLRGVPFGDTDFLLGRQFFFSTAELQLPLSSIIRVIFLPNIEGVAGFDFGSVADEVADLWPKRLLNGVLGINFIFGPLVFRVHFAKPVDIGQNPRKAGIDRGPLTSWVTNLSLTWLDF